MKRDFIVFSQRIAGELMVRGFVLKKMSKTTRDNSNRNVFYFNESDELVRVVEELKSKLIYKRL